MTELDDEGVTEVNETDWLAQQFQERRDHVAGVAYRMLGSRSEADDAVQEAWLRASRAGTADVSNLRGWMTTVVERVAFVLHDVFEIPFEQISQIIGRSVEATRQLASRARRRVRGATPSDERETSRRREIVHAFLGASREGNFDALLALLDPDVLYRGDAAAAAMGAETNVRGADAVAKIFAGRARAAQAAMVDGVPAIVWAAGGVPRVVFRLAFDRDRIAGITLVANTDELQRLSIEVE